MRAHQIMTRPVITVTPETTVVEAANIMLQRHVSGLPVVDAAGKLVGIVSEGDFIRRSEIGTQRKRGRWLKLILGPGKAATDFVHEHGGKIGEIMTTEPLTVTEDTDLEKIVQLMEKNNIKRLPVTRGDQIVGIVSRSNLLQAVASLARQIPDPTADDDHIRDRVIDAPGEERLVSIRPERGGARRHRPPERRHHRRNFPPGRDRRRGERCRSEEGSRPPVLGRRDVRDVSELAGRRQPGKGELIGRHRESGKKCAR